MKVNLPEAVLFLHAFPLNKDMYSFQLTALEEEGIPYIALDYPGFGKEPPLRGDLSIETLTDFIIYKINSFGVKKVVPVGDSMGGYIIFDMFRRYRELLKGMVFVSTRAEAESEEGKRARYELIRKVEEEGKDFLVEVMLENQTSPATKSDTGKMCRLRAMMEAASEEGIVKTLRAIAERKDSTELLKEVDIPTLVIAGKDDEKVTPPQVVKRIAEGIKNARYHELEGAAHLPPFEAPEEFNRVLLNFLKDL